jgi:hypothetical protein
LRAAMARSRKLSCCGEAVTPMGVPFAVACAREDRRCQIFREEPSQRQRSDSSVPNPKFARFCSPRFCQSDSKGR